MIKNIIFDIGGVLADFKPMTVLRNMGLSESDVHSIAEKTVLGPHWIELDRGVIDHEIVFETMLKEVDENLRSEARRFLETQLEDTVVSFDYSKALVKDLKKRGYNIYLLTNYPNWLFDYHKIHNFTFIDYVDGEIVSGKVKLVKPQKEIYEKVLSTFNLNADECVFLDDRQENIDACIKCGIHGIHFENVEQAKSDLEKLLEK